MHIEETPVNETIATENIKAIEIAPKSKEINPEILKRIITTIEDEKLFLNEELTIADLADKIGYSTKTISYTINNGLNKSFSLFINEYRVNLFKEKRASGNFNHLSIMGLAYDCGFNSKSTFNRIYKEITGASPKEEKISSVSV